MEKWIYLSDKKTKVKNPLDCDNITESYVGNINNYDFEHQLDNYNRINNLTERIDDKLKHVVSVKFPRKYKDGKHCGFSKIFLIWNDSKTIVWYKYESSLIGSGSNRLYVNGKWYKVQHMCMNYNADKFYDLFNN